MFFTLPLVAGAVLGPVIAHKLLGRGAGENLKVPSIVNILAYNWMGFLFLFSMINMTIDAISILSGVVYAFAGSPLKPSWELMLFSRTDLLVSFFMACAISVYAFWNATNIRVRRIRIRTALLPKGNIVRMTQVSDVHLGLIVKEKRLSRIIAAVESTKPDVLVSTGDMVDVKPNYYPGLASLWKQVEPPGGKYAIIGNHEVYVGLEASESFLNECGFRVLRNSIVEIGQIRIAGVDDPAGLSYGEDDCCAENNLLMVNPSDGFTVLLKHRPVISKESSKLFDLQLSGHTHAGQLFPFHIFAAARFPNISGKYDLPGGRLLYVNRGAGTWGPPMRLLAAPEVTVFEISGIGRDAIDAAA